VWVWVWVWERGGPNSGVDIGSETGFSLVHRVVVSSN
jgi:hypothetical protein